MKQEYWNKVKQAFSEAVEMPPHKQQDFLAQLLTNEPEVLEKVKMMLAADSSAGNGFHSPIVDLATLVEKDAFEDLIGKKLDNYTIVREIGRGGMGVVFEAIHEKENISQNVALKILSRGVDTEAMLRRFSNERMILASLEHQNIVRLYDVGKTSDNIPYYTMELVEGKSLDVYVKEKHLDLEKTLQIFLQICLAISYAHNNMVVHRDLKPSNILVTANGTVKLLDFGIAKITDSNFENVIGTATQFGIMTPRYASPEQIMGKSATAVSDVYSLGVILYELLTGALPFKLENMNPVELAKVISEAEQPKKPSEYLNTTERKKTSTPKTIQINSSQLKGDLDTIVLKALQKNPSRRYSSVEKLANDITLYLEGKPISARPDTFSYRAGKFIKRNQAVLGGTTVVSILLLTGTLIAIGQAVRASIMFNIAEVGAKSVLLGVNEINFDLMKLPGSNVVLEKMVTEEIFNLDVMIYNESIDKKYKKLSTIGYINVGIAQETKLGKLDKAAESYQKCVENLEKFYADNPADLELKRPLIIAYQRLAAVDSSSSRIDSISRALQLQMEIYEDTSKRTVADTISLAKIYAVQADISNQSGAEKLKTYQKSMDLLQGISEKTLPIKFEISEVNQRIAAAYLQIGDEFSQQNNQPQAIENYRQALLFQQKDLEFRKEQIKSDGTPIPQKELGASYVFFGKIQLKLGKTQPAKTNIQTGVEIWKSRDVNEPENPTLKNQITEAEKLLAEIQQK